MKKRFANVSVYMEIVHMIKSIDRAGNRVLGLAIYICDEHRKCRAGRQEGNAQRRLSGGSRLHRREKPDTQKQQFNSRCCEVR